MKPELLVSPADMVQKPQTKSAKNEREALK